ncbi:MAG TPA: M28 family metallopeptidase, partial [Vicinamibacterales bacterium]|nr:M28 family metallopeptidase [Vicinamibacterales bacterium]
MTISRRRFVEWAAAVSALAAAAPARARLAAAAIDDRATGFRPELLPSQKAVWDHQVWMAKLGPKYTGNKAHTTFVEFLATEFKAAGCEIVRDSYRLPRWEARRWEITVEPASGAPFKAPVTSYFPYSGQTGPTGVAAPFVFAGTSPNFSLESLRGKIALIDFATATREWSRLYKPWGVHPAGETFPAAYRPARGGVNDLTQFHKAGAVAVVLAWTDISDANAADQYTPFSRPPQGIPGLYVGRETGARLKALAAAGATATVVLEADVFPDTPTDTIIATLPGASADEIVIVNTHTDGPNATEENGALGILALAQYFAKIPKSQRRRTLVFPLTSGHFASPWVPSIRGVIEKHPDLVARAAAVVTVEHLGCREWLDDASMHYTASGKNEWSVAITPDRAMGESPVAALDGSHDRAAVVNPGERRLARRGQQPLTRRHSDHRLH